MPLIVAELTVWDISFRWAGYDPTKFWFRIPLAVKDNTRLLIQAILHGEIVCENMTLAKRPYVSKADSRFYIQTYIEHVYGCIHGVRYNHKLLKWATLERMEFHKWCERRNIPLPEFWFPQGWKLDFEMPEYGTYALWATHVEPETKGSFSIRYDHPEIAEKKDSKHVDGEVIIENSSLKPSNSISTSEKERTLQINQRIKVACQQIADAIWKHDLSRTIASVVKDELIQKYGGARHYEYATVRGWLQEVAPREVKNRRGRPRKNRDNSS